MIFYGHNQAFEIRYPRKAPTLDAKIMPTDHLTTSNQPSRLVVINTCLLGLFDCDDLGRTLRSREMIGRVVRTLLEWKPFRMSDISLPSLHFSYDTNSFV